MTDQSQSDSTQSAATQPFRLRSEGPRVTRLSRTVLIGGTALTLILVCGAVEFLFRDTWLALTNGHAYWRH